MKSPTRELRGSPRTWFLVGKYPDDPIGHSRLHSGTRLVKFNAHSTNRCPETLARLTSGQHSVPYCNSPSLYLNLRRYKMNKTRASSPRATASVVDRAGSTKRESKSLDFKSKFDPASESDWLELIKDIVAMANSGGGIIVLGVYDNGQPAASDLSAVLELDPAIVTDKIFSCTGEHFDRIVIHEGRRSRHKVAVIQIEASDDPLVFVRHGSYTAPNGNQKLAFNTGSVYFRHGAKSEPAVGKDLSSFINQRINRVRKGWLSGIRRVISAPPNAEIGIFERRSSDAQGGPARVRFTDDPSAPVFGKLDTDVTHPFRQTELLAEVRKALPPGVSFSSHDFLAVRRVNNIDERTRPEFVHKPKFGTPQYSDELVTWLVDQGRRNAQFFAVAAAEFKRRRPVSTPED
jgi:hypothetical protein